MHLFTWVDIRTLVASQIPLAAVFSLVLFGMRRIYPHLRGADLLATGFSLWIPATALIVAQGSVPDFFSAVGGNLLLIGCYVLMYRGVLRLIESKGALPLLYDVAAVASAVIIYSTVISDHAAPRVIAMACVIGVARGFMSVELYRKANDSRSNLFFASFLALFSVLPLCLALVSLAPASSFIDRSGIEAFSVVSDVFFLSAYGLFILVMFFGEVSAAVRQQGQLDFVTGTLNRHAIEDTLTIEIARSSRTHNPVSVMMIEIDHFKTLTDIHGHSKGDEALCTVVRTIASILRFYDKCGRLADDKFLVLLPENTAEHAMVIAGRFREALMQPTLPHDQPAITLSIGVTQCVFKELAVDVLARAELALIEARRNGRDQAALNFETRKQVQPADRGSRERLSARKRIA